MSIDNPKGRVPTRCNRLLKHCRIRDTADMGDSLEQMARSLVESGDYRVTSRLESHAEYHLPDNSPKLVAAVVDVETTGTNPHSDKINRTRNLRFVQACLG